MNAFIQIHHTSWKKPAPREGITGNYQKRSLLIHESFDSCYFTSAMLEAACGKEKNQEVLSCLPSWEQFRECSRKVGKGDSIKLNTPLHICLPSPPFIPIVVHSYLANTVIPSLLKGNIGREMDHCYCEWIKKIRLQKFNLRYFSY